MASSIRTHQDHLEQLCANATKLIDLYESKSVGILEACRGLSFICHELGISNDQPFTTIIAVDSESDHFPGSEQRGLWSKAALETVDRELRELDDFYRNDMVKAGHALNEYISTRQKGNSDDA